MTTINSIILSTIAGLGTLLGGIFIFIPKLNNKSYISLFLSISATIMLLISILELIPQSIFTIFNNYHLLLSIIISIIPFVIGVITINLLDNKITKNQNNLYKIGILSLISLSIHNFPEGIATFMSSMYDYNLGIRLTIAILLHNIPEGLCICLPIYQSSKSIKKALLYCLIASLSEPLGAITAFLILKDHINNITLSIILLFVSGLMITLSINNIYKESLENKKYFIYGILIGILIISLNLLI